MSMSTEERRRTGDNSIWSRSAEVLSKYRLLVYLVGAFLIAIGFDFQTPAMAMKAQRVAIDSLRTRVDGVESQQRSNSELIRTNLQITCLDHQEQVACKPYLPPTPPR